jgi:Uncharacterized protein conserved in bacteria
VPNRFHERSGRHPAGLFGMEAGSMAYDRYDPESRRWRDDEDDRRARGRGRDREDMDYGRGDESRGFFGKMGDEVRSWFGDEDRNDPRSDDDRYRPSYGERDYNPGWRDEMRRGPSRFGEDDRGLPRDYRPDDVFGRDSYRRTEFAGSRARSNHEDLHYEEWRRRQMEGLDRDYGEYRRERQSKFEDDFGGWRQRRQSKRQMLRDIREHMEVSGSDGEHVGTVDRVAGDRIILTRSDPQSGGVHHSLSCSDVDRVEGDRVILECSADKARERWRDESRSRALFEREDQGSAGPHALDRSFSGTYR